MVSADRLGATEFRTDLPTAAEFGAGAELPPATELRADPPSSSKFGEIIVNLKYGKYYRKNRPLFTIIFKLKMITLDTDFILTSLTMVE